MAAWPIPSHSPSIPSFLRMFFPISPSNSSFARWIQIPPSPRLSAALRRFPSRNSHRTFSKRKNNQSSGDWPLSKLKQRPPHKQGKLFLRSTEIGVHDSCRWICRKTADDFQGHPLPYFKKHRIHIHHNPGMVSSGQILQHALSFEKKSNGRSMEEQHFPKCLLLPVLKTIFIA